MTLPNAPRRGQEDARPDHFGYFKLLKGEEVFAYLAGPVLWLEMHQSDYGSKPCLEKLTGGELTCAKCKYGPPVQKGACPWWHADDHKPYMFWLDEGLRDVYDAIPWARRLRFRREKAKGAPVWAHVCLNQDPLFRSTHPLRRGPVDITRSLLRMWKMPELDMWYGLTHGSSDSALSPESEPRQSNGRPFGPMTKAAAEKYSEGIGQGGEGADHKQKNERFARGARSPSANGNHKPTG